MASMAVHINYEVIIYFSISHHDDVFGPPVYDMNTDIGRRWSNTFFIDIKNVVN